MAKNKNYTGIDYFRFFASLLIIAVHTSPLASFNETGDFILTRITARVAVPFFLMTSGFFLISRYNNSTEKLIAFIKRTVMIYGAAILLYLPVNLYNGYFKTDYLLPNILKDLVFDGTLYHLWYLPAAVMGAGIAWALVKSLDYPRAFAAASVLYLIGLFGDSYYGIAEKVSCLNSFYGLVFQITDYTRNGLFFAPVFFIMGGFTAEQKSRTTFRKSILGFGVSFALMFTEAMILHHFGLQKHDSMYLFLLPCSYFLLNILLHFKGKRLTGLKTMSLIIYIIHPMMIVFVRMFAKLLHLQELLIDNSLMHFVTVCLTSVLSGLILTLLWFRFKPEKAKRHTSTDRAYLEINLNHLEHNVEVLKKAMPPKCKLMAVVKAEAYGHGMFEIATHLHQIGVRAFAVASIDEGIRLRKYGIRGEILVLGYTSPARAKELHRYDLTQTLIDYPYSLRLNKMGVPVKTHIKIDTGMHRLGFDTEDTENIVNVFSLKYIKVCGIYTHFCASDSLDETDRRFTQKQIERFRQLLTMMKEKGIHIPKVHLQSSYGLLNYPELECDYVRAGVALYGVLSRPDDQTVLHLDLKPVLSLKTRVILIRKIRKGDSVGYSRAFIAERDTLIAVLPIGYADGYPRNLSCKKSYVLIHGRPAPVVGKICMDMLTVDVTDVPDIRVGMTATLIGRDGNTEITAPMAAKNADSITNELLSRMGRRLKINRIP